MMRLFLQRYLFFLLVLVLTACGGGDGGGGGGTVVLPTPSPRGITVVPGDRTVTISWIEVAGTTYTLYIGSSTPVTKEKNIIIQKGITSPFAHPADPLITNDKALFFVLTAVGPGGESKESIEVSTTPRASAVVSPTAIAVGSAHTCAILADKTIKCWGKGTDGQLGNGDTPLFSLPVSIFETATSTTITAGSSHTCAIFSNDTVKCWGANGSGQLGNGTTAPASTPVFVSGIATSTAITAGETHTCAILLGGTVKCWGNNEHGQLGHGEALVDANDDPLVPGPQTTPVPVSGVTAKAITAGGSHTCAIILSDNTVKCWGDNEFGQLGDRTTTSTSTPVTVLEVTAKAITAGDNHTCAMLFNDTVKCWGANGSGQLGNGSIADTNTNPPVLVSEIATTTAIKAGANHTCAILLDSTVKCWGANASGQLGNDAFTNLSTSIPVKVIGVTGAGAVAAGGGGAQSHTCAILASGIITCWGANASSQLGISNNILDQSSVLVQVSGIL